MGAPTQSPLNFSRLTLDEQVNALMLFDKFVV